MGAIARAFGLELKAIPAPYDDYWYGTGAGYLAQSGVAVTPESALKASAVFACVRIIAETLASLPAIVYKHLAAGKGKDRAPENPLYPIIHDQPNDWQTPFEWFEMMTGHVVLRGNAYSRIVSGRRGFVDQLIPLHPDRVRVEVQSGGRWVAAEYILPAAGARIRYCHQLPDGTYQVYPQEEIFHLRGLASNGVKGLSVISLARDAVGLSLATEGYGARFFSQNGRPGGVLEHPGKLNEEATKKLKTSWQEAHAGIDSAHKVAVLEEGMKWTQVGIAPDDAQFLETRKFQVGDIARWFRVPPHKIGDLEKATFSNIEQQAIEFVVDTIRPWAVRWEQAIERDLLLDRDNYFVEFLMDALLRGDFASRTSGYSTMVNAGIYTRNEVRGLENMNPIEGLDEPLKPMNMVDATAPPPPPKPALPPPPAPEPPAPKKKPRAEAIVQEAAARIVRKEIEAVTRWAPRFAANPAGWVRWATKFYSDHAALLQKALCLSPEEATAFANAQRDELLSGRGLAATESWERERVPALAALALNGGMQ